MKCNKRISAALLSGVMMLCAAGCALRETPETTFAALEEQPPQTVITVPEELPTTAPELPQATCPPETEDVTTAPTETVPSTTVPEETAPPTTIPEETEPPTTAPQETAPPETTEPPHVHAYAKAVTKPTCETGGYTVYTCACGDSYRGDETPAAGHQYTETVVPPKVGKEGYTKHLCACGKQYWDNYTTFSDEEMAAIEAELAELIRKELNRLRAEQGAGPLENQVGMSQVAQYRSRQLKNHYGHHTFDIREAHAAYQYGRYVDMTEYGFPESYNYYSSNSPEAIGWIGIIEELQAQAEHVANAFFKSEDHWSYLGDGENIYCGIGCTATYSHWMICIMVNSITYG